MLNPDVPLHLKKGNIEVIEEMEEFMKKKSFTSSLTGNENISTLKKSTRYLFTNLDSLLEFETKKNPDYRLSEHFLFKENEETKLKLLKDPSEWLETVDLKDNASRR